MNFVPIQNLIPRAAAAKGISKEFKAISVCSAFESVLTNFFKGYPTIKDEIRVRFFKDGVLTLGVAGSVIASELMVKKQQLLTALNEKLSKSPTKIQVKDLRTTVY